MMIAGFMTGGFVQAQEVNVDGTPCEQFVFATQCVQPRLVCSVGVKPTGVEVRAP